MIRLTMHVFLFHLLPNHHQRPNRRSEAKEKMIQNDSFIRTRDRRLPWTTSAYHQRFKDESDH